MDREGHAQFSIVDGIIGKMSKVVNRSRNVDVFCEPDRFPLIPRFGARKLIDPLLEKIGHTSQY